MRPIAGLFLLVSLVILFLYYSFLSVPMIPGTSSSSGTDTNKVAVSSNDTNPNFLSSKLFAGNNIALSILNPGGDEQIKIDGNGSGASDTNCALTESCPTVFYKSGGTLTGDMNALDINAHHVRLIPDPSFGILQYGDENSAIQVPFGKDTCIFNVQGLPGCTGLEFSFTKSGYRFTITDSASYVVHASGTSMNGLVWAQPNPSLPTGGSISYPEERGALVGLAQAKDFNYPAHHVLSTDTWYEIGTRHSVYAPDFLFQAGDFNNLTKTIHFFGAVDVNASLDVGGVLDVNSFAHFDKNVEVDQNLTVDGNLILGTNSNIINQYSFSIALGTSCTSACDQGDVNTGINWTCIDAWSSASNAHVLCSTTAGNKGCTCKSG